MKKTCEFYSDNVRYTADILDVAPIPGDEYMGRGEVVVTVEQFQSAVPEDRALVGDAYRLETIDDGVRYERFCFVPFVQYDIQFEAGTSRHDGSGVNFLVCKDSACPVTLYAEITVPEDASEDYGYLTLKAAILEQAAAAGIPAEKLSFWYDDQEQYLAPDASATGTVRAW